MNITTILGEELAKVSVDDLEIKSIAKQTKVLIDSMNAKAKAKNLSLQVFVGGSSAKNTLIKKRKYDIDIFVRFQDSKDIAKLKSILPKGVKEKKGSRNYYALDAEGLEFEIVPVKKVLRPQLAENVTDLSYFHVNYVKHAIRQNKRLSDEIKLAKSFAHGTDCYGAESYINGFSGYALELLVIYYGSFVKFLRAISKVDLKKKLIIDPAKHYKNKQEVMGYMNAAKLESPIIFIDPTFKERNALAALSNSTLENFQKKARGFLAKPLAKYFELENKEKKYLGKKGIIRLEVTTDKQAGDIAGTKLKKFSNYFFREVEKYFEVKLKDFDYDEKTNIGIIYLVVGKNKDIVFVGPPVKMKKAVSKFRKEHKKTTTKKGRLYAVKKNKQDFAKFVSGFRKGKKKIILEMGIKNINLVN